MKEEKMKCLFVSLALLLAILACEKGPVPEDIEREVYRRLDKIELDLSSLVGRTPLLDDLEEGSELLDISQYILETGYLFSDYDFEDTPLHKRYLWVNSLSKEIDDRIFAEDDGP